MSDYTGKAQFFAAFQLPAEHEAEADRFFAHHAECMERTHPRDGDEALLQYSVSKDPDGEGNVLILLAEVYETTAGIDNHRKLWGEEPALKEELNDLLHECEATMGWGDSAVVHSLW